MADFTKAHKKTGRHEGQYARLRHDRGGETYAGIARAHHPEWSGWIIIDGHKTMPDFPANLATAPELPGMLAGFYRQEYWRPIGGDQIADQAIADELFDTAVLHGPAVAGRFLQRCLNTLNRGQKLYPDLTVDGRIGPATLATLALLPGPDIDLLYKQLNVLQGAYIIEIMERDPTQEDFCRGWFTRVTIEKVEGI